MDDQAATTTSDELSQGKEIVLTVLTFCSASLSIIGSSVIVFKIMRDWALGLSMTPYDRIILGLSTCDILSSIVYAVNDFLSPSETSTYVWAFGNPATCQISGFLTQLFNSWAIWYNCILSYYFLLKVLSQVRLKNFVKKFEIWMHLSGIYFPITAILGYRRQWYAELELGTYCWITDPKMKWIFAGLPTMFTYLSLIVNNIVIYAVLRKSLQSSEHVDGPTLALKQLMREATTLMFLYVAFFFVTTIPTFALQILETYFGYTNDNMGKIYPLLLLHAMVLPLQGFFNVFIYIKPTYTRFRAANPNKPVHFVLHQALFNPDVPQLTFSSDESASNAIAKGDDAEEDAKREECELSLKRKVPRKMPRKKREDSDDDASLSDSTA